MQEFARLVEELKAKRIKIVDQSEASVKYHLIDPVLRYLGWTDPDHITLEQTTQDGRPDYTLKHNGKPHVIIEAKSLGKLDDKTADQALIYCMRNGVPYFVTTDGNIWRVYDTQNRVPIADMLVMECNLYSDKTIDTCRKLMALWRYENELNLQEAYSPLVHTPSILNIQESTQQDATDATSNSVSQSHVSIELRSITDFDSVMHKTPSRMVFPDDTNKDVNDWVNFHSNIIKWLIQKGHLKRSNCPVKYNRSYLVNMKPERPNGTRFLKPVNIDFVYYDSWRSADVHLKESINLIQALNQDPKKFKLALKP